MLLYFIKASLLGICLRCRRPGFDSWVGRIPWRRKWQPTPVLSPGKSHGRRSLVGYSPWGRRVGHDWTTSPSSFLIFHCVYVPLLSYPSICWWTSRLLSCPSYKQCCNEFCKYILAPKFISHIYIQFLSIKICCKKNENFHTLER